MVLWEITLATAYYLGLKRTYRLALRIQKRVIGPKHPKIRQFVHRSMLPWKLKSLYTFSFQSQVLWRIRSVFDVAVRFHKNIQERDIEVGRNFGNRIIRFLDRMKPSAEIRASPGNLSSKINHSNIAKHITNLGQQTQRVNVKVNNQDSKGKLFFAPLSIRPKSFPSIAVMMQPMRPVIMNGQYRQFSHFATAAPAPSYRMSRYECGVFRRDIAQWMLQN